MIYKNERIIEILKILIELNDYITIKKISNLLNVCEKTIRNDLKEIEIIINRYNCKLIKKPSKGVFLEKENINELKLLIKSKNKKMIQNAKNRRKIITLNLLIFNKLKISDISKNLFISKSSINMDMKIIASELLKYKITLVRKQNKFMTIEGREKNIRIAIFDILTNSVFYENYKNIIDYIILNKEDNKKIKLFDLNDISNNILNEDNKNNFIKNKTKIINILEFTINNIFLLFNNISFSAHYKITLIIFVSIIRYHFNKKIIIKDSKYNDYNIFQNEIDQFCQKLKSCFLIDLDNMEKHYIQIYLICIIKNKNILINNIDDKTILNFYKLLIKILNDKKSINIEIDNDIYIKFIEFIKSSIFRMNFGIFFKNDYSELVLKNYLDDFILIKNAIYNSEFLDKLYNNIIIDDEIIGILTILKISEEKYKNKKNILLVNTNDQNINNLLNIQLKKYLPNINLFSIEYNEFNEININNFDYVVSTKSLNGIESLIINPVLNNNDLENLYKLFLN